MLGAWIFTNVIFILLDYPFIAFIVFIFVFCYNFCFKVYFVRCKYSYSSFFWFPFAWNMSFHLFTFHMCVLLHLKWISLGSIFLSIQLFHVFWDDPKRWCWESAALNMPANLENSAVATGLENVSFHSNPKERQCQRMLKLPHSCTHLTC